jgi:Type IV secretion-system coupling protein DNA-binding domain
VIIPRIVLVVFLGTALSIAGIAIDEGAHWSRLQRRLFPTYLTSVEFNGKGHFTFLMILYPDGWRVAGDGDVVHAISSGRSLSPVRDFELSERARSLGATRLEWRTYNGLDSQVAYEWLRERVYEGRTPWELTRWSAGPGILFVAGMVPWVMFRGRRAGRESKQGHILRGPHLVTPRQFNERTTHSEGIGIETFEPLKGWEGLLGRTQQCCSVRIPRHEESSHFVLIGDSGTGKSSLIRQMLLQIRERGESAIVYDPSHEFTPQFYDADSDVILNPTDRRMPFWSPSDEIQHPADAMALANSLFPDKPRENNFFTEVSRKIFAHLLRYRPSPQDLTQWMRNLEEVDLRIAGTELEAMIPKRAVSQRAAVQGTFNQAAAAFQLLPSETEAGGRWSAVAWAQRRKGWLFFPSSPAHREGLRPLISVWLDSLIVRLMEFSPSPVPVWFILDELASLQRLPQLATILTEGRKANVCVVLGFQGRSQLQSLYDHQSEVMLSQPMTKIFLRTSEPDAAEWVSRSIGAIEVLRLEESRTSNFASGSSSKTSHWQRRTEPLVMGSTIAALPNLTGYLKSRDLVVPMSFRYVAAEQKQPAFVGRPLPALEKLSVSQIADSDTQPKERQRRQKPLYETRAPRTGKGRAAKSDSPKLFD